MTIREQLLAFMAEDRRVIVRARSKRGLATGFVGIVVAVNETHAVIKTSRSDESHCFIDSIESVEPFKPTKLADGNEETSA